MKLHIGCGPNIVPGWTNVDMKHGDLKVDVRKGLPFPDESIDLIFHEHFLEHLDYPGEATELVRESRRVLVPNGHMRIGVPDTEYTLRAYVQGNEDYFKLCRERWHPAWCTTPMESVNFHFRQAGQHKFAYDFETLAKLLSLTGFRNIGKSSYRSSPVSELNIDTRDDAGTLWVECQK